MPRYVCGIDQDNVALGEGAGKALADGSTRNVFLGVNAGANATGHRGEGDFFCQLTHTLPPVRPPDPVTLCWAVPACPAPRPATRLS